MSSAFLAREDRELQFSPAWEGECLVFDRLTTDLFVLPEIGRSILDALRLCGPMDARMLVAELGIGASFPDTECEAAIDNMLLEFQTCGLVEPLCVDCCGPD